MKAKRILTPAQKAALAKNAAKGRAKLAQMRKKGLPIGKEKMVTHEIPLDLVPMGPPPVAKRKYGKSRDAAADREAVDALAQLIVATFAEYQRRKGAL